MTPIEKNVIVVDEQGNEYEATYPKRARGLVKNGRARFVDEHTICLACPPNTELEDNTMSENKTETVQNPQTEQIPNPLTVEYLLRKIDEIAKDQAYLMEAIAALGTSGDGQRRTDLRSQALGKAIMARETTNQKLIAFYKRMYDDLSGRPRDRKEELAAELLAFLRDPAVPQENKLHAASILEGVYSEE